MSYGGAIAQYFFLESICEQHNVTLCTVVNTKTEERSLLNLQNKISGLNIEYVKTFNSKKLFLVFFLKLFSRFQNQLKLLVLELIALKNSEIKLVSAPLMYENVDFIYLLNNTIKTKHFDIIECFAFDTLSLAPLFPAYIKKIFIHPEIRFKSLENRDIQHNLYNEYQRKFIKDYELALLKKFDLIVVYNIDDASLLKQEIHNTDIVVSPYGIPTELIEKKEYSKSYNNFIFIGAEEHEPNKLGLEWFLNDIYIPNIDNIIWSITIIGKWSKTFKKRYATYEKIIFKGFLDSMLTHFENSVLISPIKAGSGIRTKILLAFANKIPVFSTRFASEGLFNVDCDNDHILFFDTQEEFISNFIKFSNSPSELDSLAEKAFDYYNFYYNSQNLINLRKAIYS